MEEDRRRHRRLDIRLPVECCLSEADPALALRTVTTNISTGGVYFEMEEMDGLPAPQRKGVVRVELTVPPGDGHFPYEGRVSSVAEVVRTDQLGDALATNGKQHHRIGIAARFREPLKLNF